MGILAQRFKSELFQSPISSPTRCPTELFLHMADESLLGLSVFTAILILFSLSITWYRNRDPFLNAIPTIGYSDPFFSYFSAFLYTFIDASPMAKLGYEKIATFRRWMVLPASAELIQEVKNAPDDVLSANEPRRQSIQMDYALGALNKEDNFQIDVIRLRLTRKLGVIVGQ
ncbi:hypothetical protein BC827DRAFT_441937 [Russula dissimulans]|nr:hypothetical protein BC827DRAFT_441937 [Russula dissimulans]